MEMKEMLMKARKYEEKEEKNIAETQKPLFHLIPRIGWMNDPNGFSYFNGEYHMFYQYHPYETVWGPMHWGHAVSKDMLKWENLPVVMAPDQEYDQAGCFSGSAIDLGDGKHLLVYTGVKREEVDGHVSEVQQQCIAIGDGVNYEKYEQNPVITIDTLPEDANGHDFRDPKIWKENDTYYLIVGYRSKDGDGQLVRYRSEDALHWEYDKLVIKNYHRFGNNWECPDTFDLDGKRIVITSPQDMLPEELEFHNGNGTLCVIGHEDEEGNFIEETCQAIDYGIDFYAPQTTLTTDGRRVAIGWLQNWDTVGFRRDDFPWFGQMSFPRELSLKNGRLIQTPIREIENYYGKRISRRDVIISDSCHLSSIEGRTIDMTVDVRPADRDDMYKKFEIRFADNGKAFSTISYDPYESIIKIDRKHSGSRRAIVHQRRCSVRKRNGELRLRLILDRYSAELFINDGEQVMSMAIFTDYMADGISFKADGEVSMDVTMNELRMEK